MNTANDPQRVSSKPPVSMGRQVVGIVLLLAVLCGIAYVVWTRFLGRRVKFGSNVVLYSGDATADDAQKLGEALQAAGWFEEGTAGTAKLHKDAKGVTLVLVIADDPGTSHEITACEVAESLGGPPILLKLENDKGKVLKEIPITADMVAKYSPSLPLPETRPSTRRSRP